MSSRAAGAGAVGGLGASSAPRGGARGTLLVLTSGFGALALVPGLPVVASVGCLVAALGPTIRARMGPLAIPIGEASTALAVLVAVGAWWLGGEAPTVMGGLLAYLQVHRRTARGGPGADRVSLVIAALMLVTAAGVTRSPWLMPCVVGWAAGLPLALFGRSVRAPAGLVIGAMGAGAALFLAVPRGPSTGATAPAGRTGFSSEVTLDDIDELLDDPSEVFRASVRPLPEDRPYWRGVALEAFDGTRWRMDAEPEADLGPPALPPLPLEAPTERSLWTVDVQVVDPAEGVLFLPGSLVGYAGPAVARDPTGGWHATGGDPAAFVAVVAPFRDREGAGLPGRLPAPGAVDPRVAELARRIAGDGPPAEKAARLTDHLREGYPYARRAYGGEDPLVEFLFERRGGHCEYFASALAVMARAVGLPSRVVNGFVGGERNPITGQWVVRRRDAHSWVEVALPGEGWVLFDPTPVIESSEASGPTLSDLGTTIGATWESVLAWDRIDQAQAIGRVRRSPAWPLGVGIGAVVAGLAIGLVRYRRRQPEAPGAPPSRWRSLHRAARQAIARRAGRPVPESLPPRALIDWVSDHAAPLADDYRALVEVLYDAVIGGRDDDAAFARASALVAALSKPRAS